VVTSSPPGRRPFGVYVIILQLLLVAALTAAGNIWLPAAPAALFERLPFLNDLNRGVYLPVIGRLFPQPGGPFIPFLPDPTWADVLRGVALAEIAAILVLITGLFRLRRWAWVMVMVANGLTMVLNLFHYFRGEPFYLSMILSLAIVFYLNSRDVQTAFKTRRQSQAAG
jgi:hypothetical protein